MNTHLSSSRTKFITRLVNLAPQDYLTVRRLADEKGLGGKGFSAALRMIIREWELLRRTLLQHFTPDQARQALSAALSSIVFDPTYIDPSDPPEIPGPSV